MKFIFNDRILSKINLTKELEYNYNPFIKKFTLTINLWIGDHSEGHIYFPGQTLYEKDIREWECSLLMIDYIRVYQNISGKVEKLALLETNNITASDICSQVMPLIRPSKPKWKLMFADEFTGNKLDQNSWKINHDEEYFRGNNNYYFDQEYPQRIELK